MSVEKQKNLRDLPRLSGGFQGLLREVGLVSS